ncbi:MAG: flavodoxin, partial [Finegoldia magna]|nr:flavodoxin [Finegoldia magna]
LEDTSFEPMFSDLENKLNDKKIALFGSYEWNNGEWMGFWKERCAKNNLNVIDTVICYDTPDENSTNDIKKFADNLLK